MTAHEFKSVIVQKGQLLPGIHGLRGFAALAVVLYHVIHLAGIVPPDFFKFIGRDFGYSVHLFFILSAFSLYHSTESRTNHPNWLPEYLIKRFFRIAPLFYCIIAFIIIRQAMKASKVVADFDSILLNFTFTFGFVPFSGFVWGGWSVGVEMIFYAIFPVLILTIRTCRSALVFLVMSIMISYITRLGLHAQHVASVPQTQWDWSYFAFAPNICFFAMGIFAYHVSRQYKESILVNRVIPFVAVIIIGGLMFFDVGKHLYGSGRWDIVTWGFGLAALCVWQSVSPSLFFANRISEYLGERSFSIYLLHPIIIHYLKSPLASTYENLQPYFGAYAYFICAILIVALVLVFSELTYRLIEVPGIRFGRKLIKRTNMHGSQTSQLRV